MPRRPPLSDHTKGMILIYQNEVYNVPPQLSPPVKKTLNHRQVPKLPICKARLNTSTNGPALHTRGFTRSPTIDFCNYNYMHRCQSDFSIQIEGYNFTVRNRTSKNKCLKYENDTKNRKNSFRKNRLTS